MPATPGLARTLYSLVGLATLAAVLPALGQTSPSADGPVLSYDFGAVSSEGTVPNRVGPEGAGRLRGAWQKVTVPEAGGVTAVALDGATGCMEVPGTTGLHLGDRGFTILATVRFADCGTAEGKPETHDMIFFKNQEYLFGRTGTRLYFNLHNGQEWSAGVTGGECRPHTWHHAAVIVDRIYEPPQGRVGYHVRLFLDGEMVGGREILNYTGTTTTAPVDLARGWGGPWYLRGELAQLSVYPRSLTEDELNHLLKQEKLAQVTFRPTADPDPRYRPALERTRATLAETRGARARGLQRLLAATTQAATHGANQAQVLPYLDTIQRLARKSEGDPVAAFTQAHPAFQFLDSDRLSVGFYSPRPGATVWCSLFDRATEREVLGNQSELWALAYEPSGGGEGRRLDSAAPSLTSEVTVKRAAQAAVWRWRHRPTTEQPFTGEVRAEFRLAGPRLTLTLGIDNPNSALALREVQFPRLRLRRLEEGTDCLLVPRMSGVLQPNPIRTHVRYEGDYPSGTAHMQFLAYYDDRRGVYVGCEDGQARSKTLVAGAAGEDCEFSTRWFVGCRGQGGNNFRSSGQVAVELFQGDWFDAAQIYKRFARTAAWWPTSRTRQDTPAWLRDLTVWLIGNANTPAAEELLVKQQQALGLPLGLHWYGWNTEPFDDDYPHFTPREGFAATVARLQDKGIYCKPYINGRLWETRDRGDEDVHYTSVALPATLKGSDGQPYVETYNERSFAPMCPTTPRWQQTLTDLCTGLADRGVAAIYLDQVAAARPRACYDPSHPHAPGAGEAWLEQGYWPLMQRIRRELQARHPQLAFCTEDAAEPYMHVFDSFLPWRFLDVGHVPAYQSIYAGRIQLTSRHFDDTSYEALFPKAAEQMLYGEQIGWCNVYTIGDNPAFQHFVKKLAHTRRAFLPFFNQGDMLKPGRFAQPPPAVTADWGFYGPRMITTPAVLHSVWRVDDSVAVLLANTTCDPVAVQFLPHPEAWGLSGKSVSALECHEGQTPRHVTWEPRQSYHITVPGYGLAAWLVSSRAQPGADHQARVAAAATLFMALHRFDLEAGMTAAFKSSERDRRNPWVVPEAPVRSALDWLPAAAAPKIVRARVSADKSFVGWIADGGALCWGALDFGEAPGTPVAECEVAVPPSSANARLRLLKVVAGQGILWAEMALKPTGSYQEYTTVRLPLPREVAGQHHVVLQVTGSGGGICNLRRWRIVREP